MIAACEPGDRQVIDRFHILGLLGKGGFGKVFAAHDHERRAELVAVKVPDPEKATDPNFRTRFAKEVAVISEISSPYVPAFLGAGPEHDPWLATELVRGLPLSQLVPSQVGLPEPVVWRIGDGIAAALSAISTAGSMHRDLNPRNVLLELKGPRIVDFGLAHLVNMAHITSSHQIVGSWEYAPPEQYSNPLQTTVPPGDIYMLGGTLLFTATGHPPHQPSMRAHDGQPNLTGLPPGMFEIVRKCLYFDPGARPALTKLREWLADKVADAGDAGLVLPADLLSRLEEFEHDLSELPGQCAHGGRPGSRPGRGFATVLDPDGQSRARTPDNPARTRRLTEPASAASGSDRPPARTRPYTQKQASTAVLPRPPAVRIAAADRSRQQPDRRGSRDNVRWTRQFAAWVQAPPALLDGLVIAADLDGNVAGLDAMTGDVRWVEGVGAAVRSAAVPLSAGLRAIAMDACVAGADGRVHAVDMETGRLECLLRADGAISGSPVVIGDRIVATSDDGCVYAIDPRSADCEVLFRTAEALGAPACADSLVVMGSADGRVLAVKSHTGQMAWSTPPGGVLYNAPLPAARRIYVAGADGILRALSTSGREESAVPLGAPVHATPARDRGMLYVGTCDGMVHGFDLEPGDGTAMAERWSRPVGDEISGLAARNGRLYVAAGESVRTFSASGQRGPDVPMDGLVAGPPALSADGLMYLAGLGGMVRCTSLD